LTGRDYKKLAKLGDSIINCVVSAALTLHLEEPVNVKVPNKKLRDALRKLGEKPPPGVEPWDWGEALVALAWLKSRISIDDMIIETLNSITKNQEKPLDTAVQAVLSICLRKLYQIKKQL